MAQQEAARAVLRRSAALSSLCCERRQRLPNGSAPKRRRGSSLLSFNNGAFDALAQLFVLPVLPARLLLCLCNRCERDFDAGVKAAGNPEVTAALRQLRESCTRRRRINVVPRRLGVSCVDRRGSIVRTRAGYRTRAPTLELGAQKPTTVARSRRRRTEIMILE